MKLVNDQFMVALNIDGSLFWIWKCTIRSESERYSYQKTSKEVTMIFLQDVTSTFPSELEAGYTVFCRWYFNFFLKSFFKAKFYIVILPSTLKK